MLGCQPVRQAPVQCILCLVDPRNYYEVMLLALSAPVFLSSGTVKFGRWSPYLGCLAPPLGQSLGARASSLFLGDNSSLHGGLTRVVVSYWLRLPRIIIIIGIECSAHHDRPSGKPLSNAQKDKSACPVREAGITCGKDAQNAI